MEDAVIHVKVLGPGCARCRATARLIEQVARESGSSLELEKVEDLQEIVRHGVLATPGVIIDGTLVHSGGVPARVQVEAWLAAASGRPQPA